VNHLVVSHDLPGQPGPGLRHPQREEVLPRGRRWQPHTSAVQGAPAPGWARASVLYRFGVADAARRRQQNHHTKPFWKRRGAKRGL